MTTKERIISEALLLFSHYGYDTVTVIDIANRVGIKDASIYNHFKSKQEILDTIFDNHNQRLKDIFKDVLSAESIEGMDLDGIAVFHDFDALAEMILGAYIPFLADPYLVQFRKLLTLEQYRNEKASQTMKETFLAAPIEQNAALFSSFIEKGLFVKCDAQTAARQFFAPMLFLMYACDHGLYTSENVVAQLLKHIKQFCRLYSKTQNIEI